MKKVLSLVLILFSTIACSNNESEESKLFKIIDKEINIEDGKDEKKGIYNYMIFNTNGCEYSIIKNGNKDIIGFKAKNTDNCKSDGVKLIESDYFLSKDDVKEFQDSIKNKLSLKNAILINGYTIKINKEDVIILKEGAPKTTSDVIRRLKELGMPIADEVNYTSESDPNELLGRPNEYIEKTSFNDDNIMQKKLKDFKKEVGPYLNKKDLKKYDKSNRKELDCTIELFNNPDDLEKRYKHIEEYVETVTAFNLSQYMYKNDNFLLRISYDITPKDAKKYEELFYKLFE